MKVEFNEECPSCSASGLVQGFAENEGAAVVCRDCKGTGCHTFYRSYTPFKKKKHKTGIKRVYQVNPGIGIGAGNGHTLEEFGGMSFEDWENGEKFKDGMEMRKYTCPAWYYQCADYDRKPDWRECTISGSFSGCSLFGEKERCWEKFDRTKGGKS